MDVDRRTLIQSAAAGLGIAVIDPTGLLAAEPVASPPSLFVGTPLAGNRLAASFKRYDVPLPDVPVSTAQGQGTLAKVGGKTRILSLWAEWCVPCLVEIRDFARLRPQFANDRFDIGLLMTATTLDRAQALARLATLKAQGLPLLVETGHRAAEQLAVPPNGRMLPGQKKPGFSLPCTLLVDARGRVRARAFGAPTPTTKAMPVLTEEQKAALKRGEPVVMSKPLTQADKDELLATGATSWSTPAGSEFLAALSGGLLERI